MAGERLQAWNNWTERTLHVCHTSDVSVRRDQGRVPPSASMSHMPVYEPTNTRKLCYRKDDRAMRTI